MKYIRGCEVKQLDIAEDFYEAYKRCLTPHINSIVVIPAFVNGFFACELYLKYILNEKGIKATGHSLAELFRKLPIELQEEIKPEFSNKAKDVLDLYKITFEILLDKVTFGFEFWRYLYEDESKTFEENFPFAYSEKFLEYFLPIISRIASDPHKDSEQS